MPSPAANVGDTARRRRPPRHTDRPVLAGDEPLAGVSPGGSEPRDYAPGWQDQAAARPLGVRGGRGNVSAVTAAKRPESERS
jgi:hypothetical protein